MKKNRKRLDLRCLELGLFQTRNKAQAAIMAGDVMVNGVVIHQSSYVVNDNDLVELKAKIPYVSRAGLKLKSAIDHFKIYLRDKICLDIGVATGGFSDCMLQEGAKKVYGIDVGKGQVHEKLIGEPRFVFMPNTNARFLKKDMFSDEIDFAAVDVSFISLKLIIKPVLDVIKENGEIVFLVKPQFELSRKDLKKGVVKDDNLRKKALENIINYLQSFNSSIVVGYIESPVEGVYGNKEFLLYVLKSSNKSV